MRIDYTHTQSNTLTSASLSSYADIEHAHGHTDDVEGLFCETCNEVWCHVLDLIAERVRANLNARGTREDRHTGKVITAYAHQAQAQVCAQWATRRERRERAEHAEHAARKVCRMSTLNGNAPDAVAIALAMLARNEAPTPLYAGLKKPRLMDWEKLYIRDEADVRRLFSHGDNVGRLNGEASGKSVDVDLDTREAIALADYFLPETDCMWGHPKKRDEGALRASAASETN